MCIKLFKVKLYCLVNIQNVYQLDVQSVTEINRNQF